MEEYINCCWCGDEVPISEAHKAGSYYKCEQCRYEEYNDPYSDQEKIIQDRLDSGETNELD